LQEAKELANKANKTTDRDEFYNSINEIKNILRELSKYEGKLPFIGSPSADLRNLEQSEQNQIELLEKRIKEKNKNTGIPYDSETDKKKQGTGTFEYTETQAEKEPQIKKFISPTTQGTKKKSDDLLKSLELNGFDEYFVKAGKFIIEKNKASIGMIQRMFKIGFNRSARIMDQLYEAGVVGKEEGTAPRKVLMTMEQFEFFIEKIITGEAEINNSKDYDNIEIIFPDAKTILKDNFDIDINYINDGECLKNLKNIIVPSTSNNAQIEVINMLLKYNSPQTMKLILIDHSVINYSMYNGVPQLLIPVVTEEKKIAGTVHWCLSEMEDRIRKFIEYRVKNINSFNEKMRELEKDTYPRIVCIINEAKEFFNSTSKPLERLLMNSNMVGIYFILFSRFSLKNLSLGIIGELLEVFTDDKLRILLSQPIYTNEKKHIIKNFDDMDGHQFERFCADILRKNGFKNVEVTQGSGDHGIDILAEKDDITYAIQCKCYSSDINNAAVQQAYTGKGFYHKDIAVVLTNQYFTPQAIEEAQAIGVKLWDRNKLNKMIGNK